MASAESVSIREVLNELAMLASWSFGRCASFEPVCDMRTSECAVSGQLTLENSRQQRRSGFSNVFTEAAWTDDQLNNSGGI